MVEDVWNPLNGCMVFHSLTNGWTIIAYPRDKMKPHFIVLDNPYPDNSKCALISLYAPEYIEIDYSNEENKWILSYDEKRELCKILMSKDKHPYPGFSSESIWKSILECYNNEVYPEERQIPLDLNKPDYMELPEN